MNIGVLSKILGHNSIKVTLDSCGTIIDELKIRNFKELKEKLLSKKNLSVKSMFSINSDAQEDLIRKSKEIIMN
jgi:hypothetical protein